MTHESSSTVGRLLAGLGGALPVVVVDSGSGDWERTAQVAATSGARVLGILQNVGYGTASNRGAWTCSTPWLAFVNPDVTVAAEGLVELCRSAEAHGFDAVAPRLVATPGEEVTRPGPAGPPLPARVL
ncbi:glycosyltransferase, partial [Cellulomonas septica]|nr:glycosyltransferase family 2 protein [Cellulomonas septica]